MCDIIKVGQHLFSIFTNAVTYVQFDETESFTTAYETLFVVFGP